jgi:hypothetical protein
MSDCSSCGDTGLLGGNLPCPQCARGLRMATSRDLREDPSRCRACRERGSTWCPHQNAVPTKKRLLPLRPRAPQPRSQGAIGDDEWTPERAALLLKAALYIGGGLVTWLVMGSSANRCEVPEPAAEETNGGDYASWEPES